MSKAGKGYMGKTLRVNLSTGEIRVEDHSHLYDDYMGNIAAKLLYDELADTVKPFDAENKIIFSSGSLVGTIAPGACKMSAATLSPVTGGWAAGLTDSYVGMEFKHAGYDHLILEGISEKPCYLWVEDDKVEIRDAAFLWGLTTWETLEKLREVNGDDKLHTLSIGPAGENLVRASAIVQDTARVIGRCGIGAVMGSKRLKAIVCKGSQPIRVHDKDRFAARALDIRRRINRSKSSDSFKEYGSLGIMRECKQKLSNIAFKNYQETVWPQELFEKLDMRPLIDRDEVAKQGFPGCAVCCSRHLRISEGPYKGLEAEPNQWECMGGLMAKLAVGEPTFAVMINAVCCQLGLDIDLPANTIAWAVECFERGILTAEDTDGMELRWGDEAMILELTHKIAKRQGFGNLLAEGAARAAQAIGRGSEEYAMHIKKQDLYESLRGMNGWALGTMVSTRGGAHTTSSPWCEQNLNPIDDETGFRVFNIRNFNKAKEPTGYEGKAEMVYQTEIITRALNSTGVCLYNAIFQDYTFTNIHDLAEMVSAATGKEHSLVDMEEIAMRQINLEKAINLRFTDFDRKDDVPGQKRHFEEIPSGPLKGWKLSRERYDEMLDEYYELHGWDRGTSYPKREVLEKLGLGNVADDLERIEKLGG